MLQTTANLKPATSVEDAPLFSVLGGKACEAILSRNSVGRIAFTLHDRVSIVPIHYVYASGWIYGRTAAAGKLREIVRNRRIAFEVEGEIHEETVVIERDEPGPRYRLTAAGQEGSPTGLFTNTRYLMPGLVLALVLGDHAENALRQSLIMSQGSLAIFFMRRRLRVTSQPVAPSTARRPPRWEPLPCGTR